MQKNPIISRMGTFFIILGIGFLILFITSDMAQTPDFDFLFVAILLMMVGWLFQRKKPAPASSGRFSMLRRMRDGKVDSDPLDNGENDEP